TNLIVKLTVEVTRHVGKSDILAGTANPSLDAPATARDSHLHIAWRTRCGSHRWLGSHLPTGHVECTNRSSFFTDGGAIRSDGVNHDGIRARLSVDMASLDLEFATTGCEVSLCPLTIIAPVDPGVKVANLIVKLTVEVTGQGGDQVLLQSNTHK